MAIVAVDITTRRALYTTEFNNCAYPPLPKPQRVDQIRKNTIYWAVRKALADATKHYKRKPSCSDAQANLLKVDMIWDMARALDTYFNDPNMTFPAIHKQCCDIAHNCFDKVYGSNVYQGPHDGFGMLQKVVNMTFKNLYCSDQYGNTYPDKFRDCEMPIDRIILAWYERKKCGAVKIKDNTWSKMSETDYRTIISDVKNYVDRHYHTTPAGTQSHRSLTLMEAEFYIWQEEQLYQAAWAISDSLSKPEYGELQTQLQYVVAPATKRDIDDLKAKL